MGDIKVTPIDPDGLIEDIERRMERMKRDKYAFQVGIKDVEFSFDQEQVETLAISPEMTALDKAELYLKAGCLVPVALVEYDGTEHQVVAWDATVVARSGFMDCVAHAIVTTDRGVFEVGRYPAVNIEGFTKTWQWFIHRRLEEGEEESKL